MIDLSQLKAPFAMQPGLQRMAVGERHFDVLGPGGQLRLEKARALQHDSSYLTAPGFDVETARAALNAILAQMRADGITPKSIATNSIESETNGVIDLKSLAKSISEAVEQDFAVLDGRTAAVPLMCVTCPSHWAPEEKIGLSLAAIHRPVADNALLLQANDALVKLATSGQHWQRWVWTITPSPRFDAHPKRHPARVWPSVSDSAQFAHACFVRSERQTLFPVLSAQLQPTGLAIFTIRVMMEPLVDAVKSPAHAAALRNSLRSMSDAVLDYKGLKVAVSPMLDWLNLQVSD